MIYVEEVKQDAINTIPDYIDYCDTYEEFIDNLWTDDSVTGNGSGSYFFNASKAKERVLKALNEDDTIFSEYKFAFGTDAITDSTDDDYTNWEAIDVRLRCAALSLIDIEDEWNTTKEQN
jgi:hypothetical protein